MKETKRSYVFLRISVRSICLWQFSCFLQCLAVAQNFSQMWFWKISQGFFLSRFQVIGTFKLSTVLKQKPETTVTKDNELKNLLLVSVDCVRHKKFPCGLGGHNIEDPTLLLWFAAVTLLLGFVTVPRSARACSVQHAAGAAGAGAVSCLAVQSG